MNSTNYRNLWRCLPLIAFLAACKGDATDSSSATATTVVGTPQIEELTQKIVSSPGNASLYATRGALWYESENFDEGIADLEKAIQLDSTKPEYYHLLADVYMDYYKSRQGLAIMERAAAAFPQRVNTYLKLAEFQLILKKHTDALLSLEHIRTIEPLNSEMFFMFGNVFADMGKTEQAITAYQSAVENNPKLVDAWVKLANLLAEKNDPKAEKYYDNAIRVDSNSITAFHAKAYFLANKKNDLQGAIQLFKKTNIIDPQYADGYYNAGLIYLDLDSTDQAYKCFDLAVKFAPTFAEAYYHRGLVAESMGNLTQARSDYDNVLRLDPDFESAKQALSRINNVKIGK